jgi:DNA-binding MurR/RpiR family transcriptional regulator
MSLLSAIREQLHRLPPKEKALAEYILEYTQDFANSNITELAARSGSSAATISRFCRTLHAETFSEFKRKLAVELAGQTHKHQYQDIVAGQSLPDIVSGITSNHIRSLTDTTQNLDIDELRRAIDALRQAKRIDLYGAATSAIVAQDFYQKLTRVGKASTAFPDLHLQVTSASSLTREDVAVGISYSGETAETIAALQCAADQGATTISITKSGKPTLTSYASISLFISSAEAGMRRGDMASRIAQLHMIDMLFAGLVSEYFDDYVPRLEQSYQLVKKHTHRKERKNR